MPTDSFRVYRTCKGYRLIYPKALSPACLVRLAKRFGEPVGTDIRYLLATQIRKAASPA